MGGGWESERAPSTTNQWIVDEDRERATGWAESCSSVDVDAGIRGASESWTGVKGAFLLHFSFHSLSLSLPPLPFLKFSPLPTLIQLLFLFLLSPSLTMCSIPPHSVLFLRLESRLPFTYSCQPIMIFYVCVSTSATCQCTLSFAPTITCLVWQLPPSGNTFEHSITFAFLIRFPTGGEYQKAWWCRKTDGKMLHSSRWNYLLYGVFAPWAFSFFSF